jgi:hypothetical protein
VIDEPPSLDGALHEIVALASPATTETLLGVPGAVGAIGAALGVTLALGLDDAELPTALMAVTLKV